MRLSISLVWIIVSALFTSRLLAADLTRAEVQSMLAAPPPGKSASFAGRSLKDLNLADLDFTGADLSGADLSAVDLRRAKLVGAKLVGARLPNAQLNFAWIIRADFSRADLSGADLVTLVVSAGLETLPADAFHRRQS